MALMQHAIMHTGHIGAAPPPMSHFEYMPDMTD